ncbi:MAG: 2-oxoacid ferredoxin oxidoreductase [Candidatus Riflebacteria bacterium]|nr:2-oxoacid ferredoxin oxidoreductase [Candidatus Riflebacteria bacterium]
MKPNSFDSQCSDIAWCPGCGNFSILEIMKETMADVGLDPRSVVLVSGIGQAAKIPHYIQTHFFNGLHGRALPVATAIRAANPNLTVIAESGDGDMYGEGGNHFLHTVRRNPNLTMIVHDNMVYGLTKGQASPTSQKGFKTPVQWSGVTNEPLNPVALAIALNASFVARGFSGDLPGTREILAQAIRHQGYALVDILQPCVTFNRKNTFRWYKEHTCPLPKTHDWKSREAAFAKAIESDPLSLGIFFREEGRPTFEENLGIYQTDSRPLYERKTDVSFLGQMIERQFGEI